MAPNGSPESPHPHNIFWTGLLVFGGIVTALGGVLTGLAKPSSGPFDLWTYPTTYMAYFGAALALIGLIGLVRGWSFPFARRAPGPMYEGVTSVSAFNSQGDLTGVTRSQLMKSRSRPDFSAEWGERDRLMQRCAGKVEEPEAVWAWVNSVYNKLLAWKPTKAMEFKPDESSVTKIPESAYKKLPAVVSALMEGYETNRSRQQLTMYGTRLAKILDEEPQ